MKPQILVVEACFYEDISEQLWAGASAVLNEANVSYEKVSVNGALEVAPVIMHLSQKGYAGYLVLGCVIQGETDHFNVVVNQSAHALTELTLRHGFLIANGIIPAYTEEQAVERADPQKRNKGGEAALALLKLMSVIHREEKNG